MKDSDDEKQIYKKAILALNKTMDSNKTLSALNKIEEEKKKLLSKTLADMKVSDQTTSNTFMEFKKRLENPAVASAFKKKTEYDNYVNSLSKSLQSNNYTSFQKTLKNLEPSLKKEYQYALKATNQYKDTVKRIQGLGIDNDKLKDMSEWIKTQKTGNVLDYASQVNSASSLLSQAALKQKLAKKNTLKDSIPKATVSQIKFQPYGNKHFDVITDIRKKREQREEEIFNNSNTQVKKLEIISEYMIEQSEQLKNQNEILSLQVKNLKTQNALMTDQQDENRKTSKVAFWTAIASIGIGVVIGSIGIFISYLVFQWEDQSGKANHTELLQVIENNKQIKEIIPYLKEQTMVTKRTNKLLENKPIQVQKPLDMKKDILKNSKDI